MENIGLNLFNIGVYTKKRGGQQSSWSAVFKVPRGVSKDSSIFSAAIDIASNAIKGRLSRAEAKN
eukprot:14481247-Ditylum_brightwellii.AAC.1